MSNPTDNQPSPDSEFENTAACVKPKPVPETGVPSKMKLKHFLLKVIDVTALGFLEPVVRLCYGEESDVQLKKIGKFIAVPVAVFIGFLILWSTLAPLLTTKSGEVPTPGVVWQAGVNSLVMHDREMAKADGYVLTGKERLEALALAKQRQKDVEGELTQARTDLEAARKQFKDDIAEEYGNLDERYKELRARQRSGRKDGLVELSIKADGLAAGDSAARNKFYEEIAAYGVADKEARTAWQVARDARDAVEGNSSDDVRALQIHVTRLADEKLFLASYVDILSAGSREERVAKLKEQITELEATYATATGKTLVNTGIRLIATREKLAQAEASKAASAKTLPEQIKRSIAAVFMGFIIACVIAIPIGVLCGLSTTFMAAMTPFIALFKPVSPIIWLVIALIIVSSFIPDRDNHWLIGILDSMWITAWLEVNPGFIASAVTVAMCSLWATLVNTALGVASVDKDHMNVARVLKLQFHQRLFKIILPSALPLVFAGTRISLGVGWMVLIAAEWISNSQGLGVFVRDAYNSGSSESFAMMFVAVFVVGAIGLILDRIMIIFQRLASFEGGVAAV